MKTITGDAALLSAIRTISEPTEVVDESGRIVARVYPEHPMDDAFVKKVEALFDFDELERLKNSSHENDRTTEQVLARLRKSSEQ